ncbi:MAG: ATP-binding protein [Candidatus Hadarchaeia archaeon]
MDISDLTKQNPWWKNPNEIEKDRYIREYENAEYPWEPRLRHLFEFDGDFVYTLRGPRQVGKTTLVKLFIRKKLEKGVEPERIFYYTCDILEDSEKLNELLEIYLEWSRDLTENRLYIFLDEISSVKNWQDTVKLLKDTGRLENATLVLTGSHSQDIKESGEMLPGRRKPSAQQTSDVTVNKILVPMKFAEFLEIQRDPLPPLKKLDQRKRAVLGLYEGEVPKWIQLAKPYLSDLNKLFEQYLITGGFPATVSQYLSEGSIDPSLYELYTRFVIGDICKWGKKENYLRSISAKLIDTISTKVGWDTIRKDTPINHHDTVKEYVKALKDSFILNIVHKCDPNKKRRLDRSHKKIYFTDPHILHSIKTWVEGVSDPFRETKACLEDPEFKSKVVETVVCDHLIRLTYNLQSSDTFDSENFLFYWHNSKEVDFLFKHGGKLWPIEVGYREEIGSKGKWIRKRFGTPLIISKNTLEIEDEYAIIPASMFLSMI